MPVKKIVFLIVFLVIFLFSAVAVFAQDELNAYFFYGDGCPHCESEEEFLDEMREKYPSLNVYEYEVYYNKDNIRLLKEVSQTLNTTVNGVPFLVIGTETFTGYNEASSPNEIEEKIKECLDKECEDPVASIVGLDDKESQESKQEKDQQSKIISLPILGQVDVMDFSLPALTIIFGILDGFNPCAMWALLFLISLLLGMKDRRRMWILGSVFILVSAIVYFFFMAAWFNLILFLGLVVWVKILIGLIALGGGAYSLKEYWANKEGACKVSGGEKRRKTFDKMRAVVQQKSFWLALGGIAVLAFAVNMIELVCSAGLPAVYTQVLALNDLSTWQYYLYILVYVFFFMLDDLFVFFIAMITLQMTGITTKYTRFSRLIGGILMVIIGLLLIFKPSWLMFG